MKRSVFITALLCALVCRIPGASAANDVKATVIPVQFQDLRFTSAPTLLDSLLKASVDYWQEQFSGKAAFSLERGPTVTLSGSFRYYGANDTDRTDALLYTGVKEACQIAGASLDFSKAGGLIFVVPGMSESDSGDPDMFWPQYSSLADRNMYFYMNGRRITDYAIVNELGADGKTAGIGTFCHEFGHVLGLKDFYDTDGELSGGLARGMWGSLSLMDKGNENDGGHTPPNLCAAERWCLSTGESVRIDSSGIYTMEPIGRNGRYGLIEGSSAKEVWLLENRQATGRDAHIGGSGLLLTHIDRSSRPAGYSSYYKVELTAYQRWRNNQVNCNPEHQCCSIVPADASATTVAGAFYTSDGPAYPLNISNISFDVDGNARFTVSRPLSQNWLRVFQTEAILAWSTDSRAGQVDSCLVELSCGGWDNPRISYPSRSDENIHACILRGLSPKTDYSYTVKAYYKDSGVFSIEGTFSTLSYRDGSFPFIFLPRDGRDKSGHFARGTRIPLTVFNAPDAVRIEWYFNGGEASHDSEGMFTISRSGTLKAMVYWADGSVDIIEKEVQTR